MLFLATLIIIPLLFFHNTIMVDDISVASYGVAATSMGSHSSRGILKKKTIRESLESDLSCSNASIRTMVTFDSVEISEHPITLGVNPAVADGGPPIEIEWECQSYELTTVDDFEQSKEGNLRTIKKLRAEARIDLLLKAGFTREELVRTEDEMSNIRLMREMSSRSVRRCNSAPPDTTAGSWSSGKSKGKGKTYGQLIKRFRLKRSAAA